MSISTDDVYDEDEWTIERFTADIEAMEDNPPPTPDWQERVNCDRHRWPTYVAHVEGMYPAECPSCIYESQRDRIAELEHRTHRRWWKWRVASWVARHGYSLGIISGWSWGNMCGHCGTVTRLYWRGKRPYILGVEREAWGCLIKRRHIRTATYITAGLCSKCCPCPTCGSTADDHYVCTAPAPVSRRDADHPEAKEAGL